MLSCYGSRGTEIVSSCVLLQVTWDRDTVLLRVTWDRGSVLLCRDIGSRGTEIVSFSVLVQVTWDRDSVLLCPGTGHVGQR